MTLKTWMTKNGCRITRVAGGRSNAFLVSNAEKIILVDTSARFMRSRLIRNLDKLNISRIDYLVLTHTHFDHAGNAAFVKEKYGARVIVHKEERPFLEEGRNPLIKGTNRYSSVIAGLAQRYPQPFTRYEPCPADEGMDDRLDLKDFGINAYLLHSPGHTQGSVSLIVDSEIALVGDTMVGTFKKSVFPPFAQGEKQVVESWGKLLKTGCRLFIPSHGSGRSREMVERRLGEKGTGRG